MKHTTSLLAFLALGSTAGCGAANGAAPYGNGGTGGTVVVSGNGGTPPSGPSTGGSTAGGKVSPMAYIGLFGDNAVALVDTGAQKGVESVPGAAPDGLVITPDGAKIYVSSASTGKVDVLDVARRAVATTID